MENYEENSGKLFCRAQKTVERKVSSWARGGGMLPYILIALSFKSWEKQQKTFTRTVEKLCACKKDLFMTFDTHAMRNKSFQLLWDLLSFQLLSCFCLILMQKEVLRCFSCCKYLISDVKLLCLITCQKQTHGEFKNNLGEYFPWRIFRW